MLQSKLFTVSSLNLIYLNRIVFSEPFKISDDGISEWGGKESLQFLGKNKGRVQDLFVCHPYIHQSIWQTLTGSLLCAKLCVWGSRKYQDESDP